MASKLSAPPRRSGNVDRPALMDRLARVADVPVVMGWPADPARADRVAVGVLADGLAVREGDHLRLP